jgi:hypothetical protein
MLWWQMAEDFKSILKEAALAWGPIPAFASREWGKLRKLSVNIVGVDQNREPTDKLLPYPRNPADCI